MPLTVISSVYGVAAVAIILVELNSHALTRTNTFVSPGCPTVLSALVKVRSEVRTRAEINTVPQNGASETGEKDFFSGNSSGDSAQPFVDMDHQELQGYGQFTDTSDQFLDAA